MKYFLNVIRVSAKTCLYVHLVYFFLVIGVSGTYAQNSQFFETLYDVPIMAGMEEIPEMALSFDKVNGRIAEAGAIADGLSDQAIISFYKQSLSQMGWKIQGGVKAPYIFIRESEKLSIFIDKSGTSPIIRFLLQPVEAVKP